MKSILKPNHLVKGDWVSILAPASPPDVAKVKEGIDFLTEAGFKVKVDPSVYLRHGYLAGSDESRADALNRTIKDPDIRGIFFARGGYGTSRILRLIDYPALTNDPKILVGYSDITALLLAVWKQCHLITFHGPVVCSQLLSKATRKSLVDQITDPNFRFIWPLHDFFCFAESGFKSESGRLLGGCLSLLTTLAGTAFEPDLSDSILFLEDIGEAPYRIDRSLMHLKNARWFEKINGLILGQFVHCEQRDNDSEETLTLPAVFEEIFKNYQFPTYRDLPVGHSQPNLTIPLGALFRLEDEQICQNEAATD